MKSQRHRIPLGAPAILAIVGALCATPLFSTTAWAQQPETKGRRGRQKEGKPVSEWTPATADEAGFGQQNYLTVEQVMSTDLHAVQEDEVVDMVASLMDWARIRHVPVEDGQGCLVGLVSYRSLLRLMARGWAPNDGTSV